MRLVLVCFSGVLLLAASAAAAAGLVGTVVDASGAPVPGAAVTITAGGTVQTLVTDGGGEFSVVDLPDGEVVFRAAAEGFADAVVRATAGTRVRLVLQPARFTDTITVTASRGDRRLATAEATTVLTSAELLNAPAGALDDALRGTPGFSLFRRSSSRVANPTTQGVTLRGVSGSGASRTRVLADGLPLNDPFGSWVYWNRVPQAAIDRVEVARGAAGDLYGADALGGVVHVLTFPPGRTRVRATLDGGSHDSWRMSTYAGAQLRGWHATGAGEWARTDGVLTIASEDRGAIDRPADSDYGTGFMGGGYNAGAWRASVRMSLYDESRGNGTPQQVNDTQWRQLSGEAAGSVLGGAWQLRGGGGTQTYYQTFTAVAGDRASERLVREQTTPSTFSNVSAQWTGAWGSRALLVGAETAYTTSTLEEIAYTFAGVRLAPSFTGGAELSGSAFGRLGLNPIDDLTLVVGARADVWRSTPNDAAQPTHSTVFLSPRASAAMRLTDAVSVQASAYRSYRTPTLNELHRGFRVGNVVTDPNAGLDPERLTGFEGGVLFAEGRTSARVTGFWNQLDGAIANVTVSSTPALITRQRQNTDTVRATGIEVEADVRPHPRWTLGGLLALTRSKFTQTPAQPALAGNRVPQVAGYQLGGSVTYVDPRAFTGSVHLRLVGRQFDDDLNAFSLDPFAVVDISGTHALRHGVNAFAAVENLFDREYDVGRTPLRSVGWPRTLRVGLRVFLPQ